MIICVVLMRFFQECQEGYIRGIVRQLEAANKNNRRLQVGSPDVCGKRATSDRNVVHMHERTGAGDGGHRVY